MLWEEYKDDVIKNKFPSRKNMINIDDNDLKNLKTL